MRAYKVDWSKTYVKTDDNVIKTAALDDLMWFDLLASETSKYKDLLHEHGFIESERATRESEDYIRWVRKGLIT